MLHMYNAVPCCQMPNIVELSMCNSQSNNLLREFVQIREGLDWDQAVKELLQAVEYLRSTRPPKVGLFAVAAFIAAAAAAAAAEDCQHQYVAIELSSEMF